MPEIKWRYVENVPEYENDYFFTKFFLGIIVVLFAFMLLMNGTARWTFSVLACFIASLIIIFLIRDNSEKVKEWDESNELDEVVNIPLTETARLVEKAGKGREMSQAIIDMRVRKIFLNKLQQERDLSKEEAQNIMGDEERMKEVIEDEVIEDFLRESSTYLDMFQDEEDIDEDKKLKSKNGSKKNYEKYILNVLKRMEDWN